MEEDEDISNVGMPEGVQFPDGVGEAAERGGVPAPPAGFPSVVGAAEVVEEGGTPGQEAEGDETCVEVGGGGLGFVDSAAAGAGEEMAVGLGGGAAAPGGAPQCEGWGSGEVGGGVGTEVLGDYGREEEAGISESEATAETARVEQGVPESIEDDDLMLDMLRAQQEEHLLGFGEKVFVSGDTEHAPGFLQGEARGSEEMDKGDGAEAAEVSDTVMDHEAEDSQMGSLESGHAEKLEEVTDVHLAQQVDCPVGNDEVMAVAGSEELATSLSHGETMEEGKGKGSDASVEVATEGAENFQPGSVDSDPMDQGVDVDNKEMLPKGEQSVGDDEENSISGTEVSAGPLSQTYLKEDDEGAASEVEPEIADVEAMVHEVDDSQHLSPKAVSIGEEENGPVLIAADVGDSMAEASQMAAEENGILSSANESVRGRGRKKRGRPPKVQVSKQQSSKKKTEEDVCFICFDGGNLVVCDRRGCPKVYHPSCVNRDEAFFRAKGRWNCGWHICSICEKAAQYMCYTCTYSLCKGCIKEATFLCVRGNKGLCETCRSTVMLIETNEQENKTASGVNFDDKNSWEYLFKDYWLDQKEQLSITLDELTKAKKPSSRSMVRNEESSDEMYDANEGGASSSDSSSGRREGSRSAKKKAKRRSLVASNEDSSVNIVDSVGSSVPADSEWASKELLEFVSHMKDGDVSVLSQFDVQALLLEYIKRNNLRDPRRKSQIICDARLVNLFGKARVGHFEMLKLLESHFLLKDASQAVIDDDRIATGDLDSSRMDAEGSSDPAAKTSSDKKRKNRKKAERELEANYDDFAAVDVHNISLIYLRRNLMEDMLDDVENFYEKVIGCFVRIRISGTGQRQDMYRLVKVVGISNAVEKYKTGKKTTDIMLEILNLDKTEAIPIDSISNQEFTEEECKRLRQSIKYGFIPRMTVGELQEKARALQVIRVNDWLETEKLRLGHLRDRASEKGRRKELRECVEKLQLLNTPEERARRLNEIPEVHSDLKMDPSYESVEEEEQEDKKRDNYRRSRDSGFHRQGREPSSSAKGPTSNDCWNIPRKGSTATLEPSKDDVFFNATDAIHGSSWGRDKDMLQHNNVETPGNQAGPIVQSTSTWSNTKATGGQVHPSGIVSGSSSPLSTGASVSIAPSINESEKMWHYQDPSGKTQGPFSMVQLRKWNSNNYFPRDLRIWKTSEKQEDSILLTDALLGKFDKELPARGSQQNSLCQSVKAAVTIESRINNREVNWRSNNDSAWATKKQTDPCRSGQSDTSFSASANYGQSKADGWGAPSSASSLPLTRTGIPNNEQVSNYTRGWESSKGSTTSWPGPNQIHNSSVAAVASPGKTYELPHPGRGDPNGSAGRFSRAQDRGGTWNSNRPTAFQSSGHGYEIQSTMLGSSGQQSSAELLKAQHANPPNRWGNDSYNLPTPTPNTGSGGWGSTVVTGNHSATSVQPTNSSFGSNQSLTAGGVNKSSAAPLESTVTGSIRSNQSRARMSRWDPTPASSIVNSAEIMGSVTANPGRASSHHKDMNATLGGNAIAGLVTMDPLRSSPTPKFEQSIGSNPNNDPQSNSVLSAEIKPIADLVSAPDSVASAVAETVDYPGYDRLQVEKIQNKSNPLVNDMAEKSELQVPTPQPNPQLTQKNLSPSIVEGNGNSSVSTDPEGSGIQKPAAVMLPQPSDVKNAEWSMPSPTPSTDPVKLDASASIAPVHTPPFSDSSRPPASTQGRTNASVEPPSQLTMNQTSESSNSAAPINSNTGWGAMAQANANVAWGAMVQGSTNAGWAVPPQGNANLNSGWESTAPCTPAANTVPMAPGPGTPNPMAGWGPMPAQGVLPANAGWGAVIQQVNPNINPGWGVAMQGYPNPNPCWVTPATDIATTSGNWGVPQAGNTISNNTGWSAVPIQQGNQTANPGWGMPNGNMNMGWNSSAGNPNQNQWGPHKREQKDRYSGNRNGGDQGRGGGRHRMQSHNRGPSRGHERGEEMGICKYYESGQCRRGASCKYSHT